MSQQRTYFAQITIIISLAMMWTVGAAAAPDIEFANGLSFDFGDVRAETTLEHTFTFTNTGDQILQIPQVKGG